MPGAAPSARPGWVGTGKLARMVPGSKAVKRAGVSLLAVAALALGVVAAPPTPAAAEPGWATRPALLQATQLPAPLPARGRVVRLYQAVFLRAPDLGGLTHWETRHFLHGTDLYAIADHFVTSSEFQRRYGSLDDAAFVTLVYRNVLGREPDPAGSAFWRGRLASGFSRGSMMVGFSESSEYVRTTRTGVAHLVAPLPGLAPGSLPRHDDWLAWLNLHRTGAGLPALTEEPEWSEGARAHAVYSVRHQVLEHSEEPSSPIYTPEGDDAAQSSNLLGSGTELSAQQAIESWLNSPGHGAWMINPGWTTTGYGQFHDPTAGPLRWVGVLDVVRGATPPGGAPPLVRFPADGQVVHYEPLRAFVIFPSPIITSPLAASASINGVPTAVTVAASAFGGHPTNTAVVTLANRPSTGDQVSLTVVAGAQSTSWSFEVGVQAPEAPVVASASTTPSGLIALRLAPPAGQLPDEVTHTIVELWSGPTLLERQVLAGPEARTAFLHAGPPRPGLEVRLYSQGPAGRSTPRILRY